MSIVGHGFVSVIESENGSENGTVRLGGLLIGQACERTLGQVRGEM